ncbi:lytic transglycosylase domain-containing protein [Cardiobacterium valvarum]|jgi:virB1|uniref:Type IV secretion system lytic transglycosylase VirB1 n=1 Tax=Cardiobacterium valvarum TaxID=194702 RepID=A0A381EDJ1_9GAMM|nr:lytic transglycosylase domain-containing protein [Cardiobacterium valvarum]SUX24847.1 type IV secretion system lytic transglycosylase VirB1 [Cardiobacterium valvarum]
MFEFLGCPVAVEPAHMQAVVAVESAGNPFAVGVVGHYLNRQPRNATEALALVQELRSRGINYSVGIAQVNKVNFAAYGLTDANLFDRCANLNAGSRILAACYAQHAAWDRAYSCYYSGNPRTGFSHGYVAKVQRHFNNGTVINVASARTDANTPIQIFPRTIPAKKSGQGGSKTIAKKQSLLARRLSSSLAHK